MLLLGLRLRVEGLWMAFHVTGEEELARAVSAAAGSGLEPNAQAGVWIDTWSRFLRKASWSPVEMAGLLGYR